MDRRVVITGVGAVTPLGMGANTLVERWTAGECGIEDGLGRCADFDPVESLGRREARRTDRSVQFLLVAAQEALEHAGWGDEHPIDPERVGCVIGTGIGGLTTLEDQHDVLREKGPRAVSPLAVPLMMANAGSAGVAMRNNLLGPVFGVVSACAAGAQAVGAAVRMIAAGDADAVVAGGTEAALTPLAMGAFMAMGATSEIGISRPFDVRRDGFIMAEGAGILILEDAETAAARGAPVLAEILGYGATSDAHHLTAPDPAGRGAARAIVRALEDAGRTPADIDYINAHGTSTPLNDRTETLAIRAALGEYADRIPVSSTKSAVGHMLGAAGAVEAIATVLALRNRVAPPTLGYGEPEEGLDLDYIPDGPRPLREPNGRPLVALSNSFGFGGHNAVLCLGVA
jgi:3-oxoacyl-[acyl-carrier-protein] synthase II